MPTLVLVIATPESATPGASWNVPEKVRFRGSFSSCGRLVTFDTSLALVSTRGVAAVTVTSSVAVARRTGRTSVSLMAATITSCWNAPRPCSSARSLYVPGVRFRNWKVPSERVVAVRPRGICGPEIETRTPGRGDPDESRATPETEPVVWAKATGARNRRARTQRAHGRYRCMRILLHQKNCEAKL